MNTVRDGLVLFGVLFVNSGTAREAVTWDSYGGHSYRLSTLVGTWHEAEAEAVADGGHLVTVNDAAENDWLWATYCTGTYPWLWLGFTDVAVEGDWQWVNGEAVTYTKWNNGEPNDFPPGEDYALIYATPGSNGKWVDADPSGSGGGPARGIIEVPEPATFCLLVVGSIAMLRRRR